MSINIQENQTSKAHGRNRFAVIGEAGAGKTTLTKLLSKLLGLRYVEVDKLDYITRYENKSLASVIQEILINELKGKRWIAECHYARKRITIRDVVLTHADTVIWLDYPLSIILSRLIRRSFNRIVSNSERKYYWKEGHRSKIALKREFWMFINSILRYLTRERKKTFQLLYNPRNAHLNIIRLSSPIELDIWLFMMADNKTSVRNFLKF